MVQFIILICITLLLSHRPTVLLKHPVLKVDAVITRIPSAMRRQLRPPPALWVWSFPRTEYAIPLLLAQGQFNPLYRFYDREIRDTGGSDRPAEYVGLHSNSTPKTH